nr:hypothetical protein [Methanobrevibacter arboriphilus]
MGIEYETLYLDDDESLNPNEDYFDDLLKNIKNIRKKGQNLSREFNYAKYSEKIYEKRKKYTDGLHGHDNNLKDNIRKSKKKVFWFEKIKKLIRYIILIGVILLAIIINARLFNFNLITDSDYIISILGISIAILAFIYTCLIDEIQDCYNDLHAFQNDYNIDLNYLLYTEISLNKIYNLQLLSNNDKNFEFMKDISKLEEKYKAEKIAKDK